MARLWTCGWETGSIVQECPPEGSNTAVSIPNGTPTISSATKRTGDFALTLGVGGQVRVGGLPVTSAVPQYARAYVYFTAFPASAGSTRQVFGRASGYGVRVNSAGQLGLFFALSTQVGSLSSALSLNTWYRVELLNNINTLSGADDSGELRIEGVTVASETNVARGTAASSNTDFGDSSVTNTYDAFFDDCAINDNTGSAQTSWPGPGKVDLLKPVSDNARVDWVAGAGATTNLYDAVNNTPGVGVAEASATNASQIKDITNGTTDTYDANVESYATAGVPAGSAITLCLGVSRVSPGTTTNITAGVQVVSNPAIAEVTRTTGTVANGAEPTGWGTNKTAPAYAPSVTMGTSPVVRSRKGTNSVAGLDVDLMGLYVEYVPPTAVDGGVLDLVWDTKAAVDGGVLDAKWDLPAEVSGPVLDLVWDLAAETTVPVRELDGVDDEINVGAGTMTLTSGFTLFVLCAPRTAFQSSNAVFTIGSSGGGTRASIYLGSDGSLRFGTDSPSYNGISSIICNFSWQMLAVTLASNGSTPRLHRAVRDGSAWTHENSPAGAFTFDPPSGADTIQGHFGRWQNGGGYHNCRYAVAAVWNRGLSDAEIESILDATQDLAVSGGGPAEGWEFDQSSLGAIENFVGSAAETSRVGTTVHNATGTMITGWTFGYTAGTTPVDGPVLDLLWDTKAEVASAVTELVWDTKAEVSGGVLDLVWDTKAAVDGAGLDLLWDLRAAVASAVTELVWDLRAEVASPVTELVWDMKAEVASAVTELIWDLRSEVSSPVTELVWDLRSAVDGNVLDLKWDLPTSVDGGVLDLVWDTRAAVNGAALDLVWDLAAQVNGNVLDLLWDLVSTGQVNGDPARLVWDLRAEVASTTTLKWDLAAQVNSAQQRLVWDLRSEVASAVLDLLWDLRNPVDGAQQRLVWDTRAAVNGAQQRLLWDLRAATDATPLSLRWDTRAEVNAAILDLAWDLRAQTAGQPLNLTWAMPAEVEAELALVWDLVGQVDRLLTLIWRLRGPEQPFAPFQPTATGLVVPTSAADPAGTGAGAGERPTTVTDSDPTTATSDRRRTEAT